MGREGSPAVSADNNSPTASSHDDIHDSEHPKKGSRVEKKFIRHNIACITSNRFPTLYIMECSLLPHGVSGELDGVAKPEMLPD